jgi:single-strand DNA-binding protein
MNKISATGRLAADCEVRFTAGGDAIANVRLASDVGFGDKKTTNWFTCTLFGKRGEALAPYLTKGQQVTVFGTLTMREWTTKDGVKQLSPDIRIDEIELQGGKQQQGEQAASAPAAKRPQAKPQQGAMAQFDDDIPFAPLPRQALTTL